jgi:hypothetical protein
MYVANGAGILEFAASANGNVSPIKNIAGSKTTIVSPEGVAVGPTGKVYLTDDGTLSVLAATIDRQVNYLVFITPQGESRGLYVTNKTSTGFEVRENGNGASSIAFDYRIVAKPYGELSKRLPMLRPDVGPDPSMLAVIRHVSEAKSQVGAEIARERERVVRQTTVARLHLQALNRRLQSITPAIATHT